MHQDLRSKKERINELKMINIKNMWYTGYDKKIFTKWQKNFHKVTKKFSQNDKKIFTKWQKNFHKMTKILTIIKL